MCANYDPTAEIDFEAFSQFPKSNFDYSIETWKDYAAPILRKSGDQSSSAAAAPRMSGNSATSRWLEKGLPE